MQVFTLENLCCFFRVGKKASGLPSRRLPLSPPPPPPHVSLFQSALVYSIYILLASTLSLSPRRDHDCSKIRVIVPRARSNALSRQAKSCNVHFVLFNFRIPSVAKEDVVGHAERRQQQTSLRPFDARLRRRQPHVMESALHNIIYIYIYISHNVPCY